MTQDRTVFIRNLGCAKNIIDGERMMAHLSSSGYKFADDPSDAKILLVNTCAFINEAKQEAIDTILEMGTYKNKGQCETLAVAGCFSQRYRDEAAADLPEVDVWLGVDDWPKKLKEYFATKTQPEYARVLSGPIATQYLKIAEGCSNRCAFCAIPMIRGPFKSKTIQQVTKEALWLESQGAKECILVSQETSRFGSNPRESLTKLIEHLLKKTSFPWIRTMYLHPARVSDDFLRLVASEPRLCSYFDIPFQHISDPILKAMKRSPSSKRTYELIERIRRIIPDAAIRTTFILGFPGETERDFKKLLDFVEWAKLDKVGVFPFSPEEGTAAHDLRPRPRESTAARRCEMLMEVQKEISADILSARVGQTVDMLIDTTSDVPGYPFEGRTQWDAPEIDGTIFVKGRGASVGSFTRVKITSGSDYDLYGKTKTS